MGDRWETDYRDRSDVEKLQTQWIKASGLLKREDWSAAVVRMSTAMELAANLAVIEELTRRPDVTKPTPDRVPWLYMENKFETLLNLLPEAQREIVANLKPSVIAAYNKRNDIVHRGEFCAKEEAHLHAATCAQFVPAVVRFRRVDFVLSREAKNSEEDPGS